MKYSYVTVFYNRKCLKCGRLEYEMVKCGAFVMCNGCYGEEFKTDKPPELEREKYKTWLDVYQTEISVREGLG